MIKFLCYFCNNEIITSTKVYTFCDTKNCNALYYHSIYDLSSCRGRMMESLSSDNVVIIDFKNKDIIFDYTNLNDNGGSHYKYKNDQQLRNLINNYKIFK